MSYVVYCTVWNKLSIVYFSRPCLPLYVLDILLILQLASQEKASKNVGIDVNQIVHLNLTIISIGVSVDRWRVYR